MFDITPYRFQKWRAGTFCCWDFVRLVLKDYLQADLSPVPYLGGPRAAAEILGSDSQRQLFEPLSEPQEFCVVEMQRFRAADHVGVYVMVDGQPHVAHCETGAGVLLSTLEEITDDYKITGYYRYVGKA